MKRRDFFKRLVATPVLPILWKQLAKPAQASATLTSSSARRVHSSDSSWPNAESWEKLRQDVGGNLVKVESPLAVCESAPDSASCQEVIKNLRNPYFIGDQAGGTQTSGWWTRGLRRPACTQLRSEGPTKQWPNRGRSYQTQGPMCQKHGMPFNERSAWD
jgi:hypothetical protein